MGLPVSPAMPYICAMPTLLNLIYRLPLEFIVRCFLLVSLAWLCARHRFGRRRWFLRGVWGFLTLWFAAVLWITVFSRSPGPADLPELIPFHSYRELFTDGHTEIIRSNFMNIALFYPAGLLTGSLLPDKLSRWQKLLFICALFASLSLAIEYAQFRFALGEPEADDVLHNTLGAVLGTLPIVLQKLLHDPAPPLP